MVRAESGDLLKFLVGGEFDDLFSDRSVEAYFYAKFQYNSAMSG